MSGADVGRRWVAACEAAGVEAWAPGMSGTIDGHRKVRVSALGEVSVAFFVKASRRANVVGRADFEATPNLSDGATKGAALGIVRRAWGIANACTTGGERWGVVAHTPTGTRHLGPWCDSEAEALVASMWTLAEGGER